MPASMVDLPAPKGEKSGNAGVQAETCSVTAVVTGLGDDVDKLVAKSPSLQRDLQQLQKDRWTIKYGPEGSGSTADRRNKIIQIDGSEQGDPLAATQTLAHEVGHASYQYKPDYSSKSAYMDGVMADEGAATLNNIKVQREILANGGPNIGIAGNGANHATYNAAYDDFVESGDANAARKAIGRRFCGSEITSNTGQSYADYYGGWYDRAFPEKK